MAHHEPCDGLPPLSYIALADWLQPQLAASAAFHFNGGMMAWAGFFMLPSLALFAIETILYMVKSKPYFLLGPPNHRLSMQTGGGIDQVLDAIRHAGPHTKLRLRFLDRQRLVLIRFRWWDSSIWSRAVFRLHQASHGTAISYEVRPFISPAFVGLSVLLLFRIGSGFSLLVFGYFMIIVMMYVIGLWWDVRKFKRSLQPVLTALKPLGLSICDRCGYDRFGLNHDAPCPECGHRVAPDASQAPRSLEVPGSAPSELGG